MSIDFLVLAIANVLTEQNLKIVLEIQVIGCIYILSMKRQFYASCGLKGGIELTYRSLSKIQPYQGLQKSSILANQGNIVPS